MGTADPRIACLGCSSWKDFWPEKERLGVLLSLVDNAPSGARSGCNV